MMPLVETLLNVGVDIVETGADRNGAPVRLANHPAPVKAAEGGPFKHVVEPVDQDGVRRPPEFLLVSRDPHSEERLEAGEVPINRFPVHQGISTSPCSLS